MRMAPLSAEQQKEALVQRPGTAVRAEELAKYVETIPKDTETGDIQLMLSMMASVAD